MRIDVVTIFPSMFGSILGESILKRAQAAGKVKIVLHDIRDYAEDKHRKVDDRPYGGGSGMVMIPKPIFACVEHIRSQRPKGKTSHVILLCPRGKTFDQKTAQRFARYKHFILICGHYEGIDERVREYLVDEEISIGDYVLTGGELPAMVLIDAVVRLLPGVLGNDESVQWESFRDNLLEYPQYTRPAVFKGQKVPEVLLSGDHQRIAQWRKTQSLKITKKKRPDLLKGK